MSVRQDQGEQGAHRHLQGADAQAPRRHEGEVRMVIPGTMSEVLDIYFCRSAADRYT